MHIAEKFLVGVATIQCGIVFSWHEPHGLRFEMTDDVAELCHSRSSDGSIVGRLSEISSEHDEIRLLLEGIHGRDCLQQCSLGIGIDGRPVKSPVGIGNLNEIKGAHIVLHLARAKSCAGNKNGATNPGKPEKVTTVHLVYHS